MKKAATQEELHELRVATEANHFASVLEAAARGLKRRKHQASIKPARAKIKAVMAHYFGRQEKAVLAAVRPHIARQLMLHPQESISSQGRTFANALLPRTLHPLSFAASSSETSEYNAAIGSLVEAAGAQIAKELSANLAEQFSAAAQYLHDNSLSKLTGDLEPISIERLQDALAKAWDAGGDADSMVAAIHETFSDFSETRAELIAQTEANDAYATGRHETALAIGADEKSWDTDGEACEDCQANADEGWIDIDEEFPSGDQQPTAHPGCDCSTDYRISE